MFGTELGYGTMGYACVAMGCAVLTSRTVLCDTRVQCYGLCGTDVAYNAMGCAVLTQRTSTRSGQQSARTPYGPQTPLCWYPTPLCAPYAMSVSVIA
eukprot:3941223-Rhodomonas_salina.2